MSGEELKAKVKTLPIASGTKYAILQELIVDGVLDSPKSSEEIVQIILDTVGSKWKTVHIQTYMKKFLSAKIVHAVKPVGGRHNYWVLRSVPRVDALKAVARTREGRYQIDAALFSDELIKQLKKDFGHEIEELHDNFGRNGNCSAFLLRKILEKLIIIAFSKNGVQALLDDTARPGGWKGLKEMVQIAARERIGGIPFLLPKTANEIRGIKFLGDTAAHNPLVGVDMPSIVPQMPFIITAYKELARHL